MIKIQDLSISKRIKDLGIIIIPTLSKLSIEGDTII